MAGVGFVAPAPRLPGETSVTAEIRVPVVLLTRGDGVAAGGGLQTRLGEGWGVEAGLQVEGAWARSLLGGELGLGTDLVVRPGWRSERWAVGLEAGWTQGWWALVRHSDAAMDLFGARPAESTFAARRWRALAAPATRLRAALAAGVLASPHLGFGLSGGLEVTPNRLGVFANPELGQLPFVARFAVEVRP